MPLNPTRPRKTKVAGYGPAMSSLSSLQRRFVEVLYEHPGLTQVRAVELAGYKGKWETIKKMGQRLMRNPLVLDAIREAGETTYRGKLPKTINAIDSIIANPDHKDHVKVLHGVLDRVGMHPVSETRSTVTHTVDRTDLLSKIAALMEKSNIALPKPAVALPVVEAEFTEATKGSDD